MSSFWFCENQKSDIPPQKNRKSFDDLQIFGRKSGHFCVIFDEFWIFYYTDVFFSSVFDFFPQKNRFSRKKVQKNWKSKNGVKTALTPLFKELWAIFVFLKFNNPIYANPQRFFGFLGGYLIFKFHKTKNCS